MPHEATRFPAQARHGIRPAQRHRFARLLVAAGCCATIALLARQLARPGTSWAVAGLYPPHRFLFLLATTYGLLWAIYFALAGDALRRTLANCAVATLSIAFCWSLLELPALLGIADYRLLLHGGGTQMTRVKPWNDPRSRFDRELMYTRRPGARIAGDTEGDLVHWLGISSSRRYSIDAQYDRNGFRNDHEIYSAPLALIGDSFLEAGLLKHPQMASTLLRERLNLEVANLGLGGYGPQQELAVLRRYAMPLHPKLVVWFFFEGNDLLDVRRYDRFARDADATLQALNGFAARSFSAQALSILIDATTAPSSRDATLAHRRSCQLRNTASEDATTIYFGYPAKPLSPVQLASLARTEDIMLEAQQLTQAGGAALMLVYVPIKFRVYQDLCEPPTDGSARHWQLNDLPRRLAEWSAAHGIPFLDLTPALTQRAAAGELVYFPDDGHWNASGNAVAAAAVADAITQRELLPTPPWRGRSSPRRS